MGSIPVKSTTNDDYPSKVPKPGVWCPAVTFFNPATDELDLHVQAKYYSYLSRSGLTGLVILGTNAETLLLTREERAALLATARKAVGPDYPIMAGVSGHSTKQVLEYIADAYNAGANYVLVLPAAYFGKQTTPSVITRFYDEVAEKSPLPIVIYNFPAVCNGVDLDSETITTIAQKHKNVVGVKLTCASVGKIVRLAASLKPEEFSTFGGQSDFLIGGLSSGSAGCIAAFANIFPGTIARIYELYKAGHYKEALKLHQQAALAENPVKAGIAAVKYGVSLFSAKAAGIENAEELLQPRRPYEALSDAVKKKIKEALTPVNEVELKLQSTKA
jgi:4-hydroxy-2-oxoglutarate aldolase